MLCFSLCVLCPCHTAVLHLLRLTRSLIAFSVTRWCALASLTEHFISNTNTAGGGDECVALNPADLCLQDLMRCTAVTWLDSLYGGVGVQVLLIKCSVSVREHWSCWNSGFLSSSSHLLSGEIQIYMKYHVFKATMQCLKLQFRVLTVIINCVYRWVSDKMGVSERKPVFLLCFQLVPCWCCAVNNPSSASLYVESAFLLGFSFCVCRVRCSGVLWRCGEFKSQTLTPFVWSSRVSQRQVWGPGGSILGLLVRAVAQHLSSSHPGHTAFPREAEKLMMTTTGLLLCDGVSMKHSSWVFSALSPTLLLPPPMTTLPSTPSRL